MQNRTQSYVIGACLAALSMCIFFVGTAVGAERVWIGKPGPSCIDKCNATAHGRCDAIRGEGGAQAVHFCLQNYLPNCVSACRRR